MNKFDEPSDVLYEYEIKNMNNYWYSNDLLHWLNIDEKGNHFYYLGKELHREDGPACEYSGTGFKVWYLHGKSVGNNSDSLHREGFCRTQEEFEMLMKLKAFW